MINIENYSLPEKALIVAREIVKHSRDPEIIDLARKLGNPFAVFSYLKQRVKYRKEKGDVLYEPEEVLRRGYGDCEDLTVLFGSIVKAQGYPVGIRLVRDGTRHIYPIVLIRGNWTVFDLTPSKVPYIQGIPAGYRLILEGIVTDDHENPLGSLDFGKYGEWFTRGIFTAAGAAIGSAFMQYWIDRFKKRKKSLSGLVLYTVEVPEDYVPKAGDHLLFYFKPKWWIPDRLEEWILKKVVKRKVKNAEVLRAYFKKNRTKYLVVEVVVKPEEKLSGIALTALAIAGLILAGGLSAWFVLDKVEKVVETPEVSSFMKLIPYAIIAYAVAKVVRR